MNDMPSLKTIARRRIHFHLDDLVHIGKDARTQRYFWACLMAEPGIHTKPTNYIIGGLCVACGEYDRGYATQEEAEEGGLSHIVNEHRAQGGEKLPKGRGTERRERKIEQWNARRRAENAVHP